MEILIPLVIVLFIALGVYGWWAAQQRRKALAAWAALLGLSFDPSRDGGMQNRLSFACLRQGDDRYAYNIMQGPCGKRRLLAFDYHYETHSTDSKGRRSTNHHHFSALVLASPVPLKPLLIRPEGLFDKLKGFFGFEDINFESAEFSRKFFVSSPDRKWAYDVLHQRTMEFLLAEPKHFCVEFDPVCVMIHGGGTFAVADFDAARRQIEGLLDRLPEYLVKQQVEQNGGATNVG